jgi:hypothetical protein
MVRCAVSHSHSPLRATAIVTVASRAKSVRVGHAGEASEKIGGAHAA